MTIRNLEAEEITALAANMVINHEDEPMFARGNGTKVKHRVSGPRDLMTQAEMRAQIAILWKDPQNFSLEDIAARVSDQFGLTGNDRLKPRAIRYHVSNLIEYWKKMSLMSVDDKMAMVQARYAQIEAIAEEGLFRSMEGKEVHHYRKQVEKAHSKVREKWIAEEIDRQREELRKAGKNPMNIDFSGLEDTLITTAEKIEKFTKTESNDPGDPRFIRELIVINDKRAELWNLKKHAEVNSTDQEMAGMSDEARDKRMVAVLQSAIQRRDGAGETLAPAQPLGGHKLVEVSTTFSEDDLEGLDDF